MSTAIGIISSATPRADLTTLRERGECCLTVRMISQTGEALDARDVAETIIHTCISLQRTECDLGHVPIRDTIRWKLRSAVTSTDEDGGQVIEIVLWDGRSRPQEEQV